MKVFVAGGTGVIGTRAVPALVEAGHEVTAVARSTEKEALVRSMGATPVRVDLFDADAVQTAVAGHEAVVNLATHIPDLSRAPRQKAWQENDRIRTEAAANLAAAARRAGATRFVQESITFPYVDRGDDWIDELVDRPPSETSAAVDAAEASTLDFTGGGRSGVVLRFAQFYAPDASHTRAMAKLFRTWVNPLIGRPDARVSFIGMPAAARAVVAALGAPAGVYNVADGDPPTRKEAGAVVAEMLGKRSAFSLPMAMVKPVNPAAEILARSHRIDCTAFTTATGWVPDHDGAAGFAAAIVAA